MNFNDFFHKYSEIAKIYREIGRLECLQFIVDKLNEKGFSVVSHFNEKLSKEAKYTLNVISTMNELSQIEMAAMSMVFASPKVFRPTMAQFRLLAEMKLNIPSKEYVQPFQTVVIEIPKEYRCVNNPIAGTNEFGLQKDFHKPSLCVLVHTPDLIVSVLIFDSETSIKSWCRLVEGKELEEWFNFKFGGVGSIGELETSLEEEEMEKEIKRACLNYCLLLDEVGIIKKSSKQEMDLEKKIRKGGSHLHSNKERLQYCPKFYDIKQEVKLYNVVDSHQKLESEPTGRIVRPHHRRGHYRMQLTKEGKKRIRIPPVFVNKHLFLGGEDLSLYIS